MWQKNFLVMRSEITDLMWNKKNNSCVSVGYALQCLFFLCCQFFVYEDVDYLVTVARDVNFTHSCRKYVPLCRKESYYVNIMLLC